METKALLRPLVRLATHELVSARTASRSNADTPRHLSTSNSSYTFIPDYLLPPSIPKKHHVSAVFHRRRSATQFVPTTPGHLHRRRMFSATPTAKAATVIANPRKDEDGKEMLIDITARAAEVCSFHYFATSIHNDC